MSSQPPTATTDIILYVDEVFAPLDLDHQLERIAGGFETEVYRTDDYRFVVKLKSELGGDLANALAATRRMRATAEAFAQCLGRRHSVPSHYVISRDSKGLVHALVVQPFIRHASPLYKLDYAELPDAERARIARQLEVIIRRTLVFYHRTGYMPDLYGLSSRSHDERIALRNPAKFPGLLWEFLVKRNLLTSHNLLLTDAPDRRVLLVDYDLVRWPWAIRRVYFAVRRVLHWRDRTLIRRMRRLKRKVRATPLRYTTPMPL